MAECLQDSDTLGLCSAGGDDQCQNYQYDGFKLCCPDGLDVDHFWPRVRTTLQRGPRPLAPNEQCPNGCDVASTVDKFVCAYFKRVGELKQLFEELETFTDMDLKSIIDFKRQFVRRYNEVNAKSQRSLSKMMEIQQLITSIVRVTQENDILIKELEGEVAEVQVKVTKIDTDLANLHQFCKVGKQCAKQCYFPPELFGGIKKVKFYVYQGSFDGIHPASNTVTANDSVFHIIFRTVLNTIIPISGNKQVIHPNGLDFHNLVSISSNPNQISHRNMPIVIRRRTVADGLSSNTRVFQTHQTGKNMLLIL